MIHPDDRAVIDAFVDGAPAASGPTLHVERDVLYSDGRWHVAFRLAADTFLVGDEPTPGGTVLRDAVAEILGCRGLTDVPADATDSRSSPTPSWW